MFNLIGGVFMSFASFFGGLFGGHASSTPFHLFGMGSTTPSSVHADLNGHEGSTTPDHGMMMGPGIMGTVESISGTTLTVLGMADMHSATTTYTVDASNAKIIKQKVGTTTISSIVQGDHVMVSGTVSGTSVTAKFIIDGMMMPMGDMHMGSSTRPMWGNGNMGSSTHPGNWNPGGPMHRPGDDQQGNQGQQ